MSETLKAKRYIAVFIPDSDGATWCADVYTHYRGNVYTWSHVFNFQTGAITATTGLHREPLEEILVDGDGIKCEQYDTFEEILIHNLTAFL